MAGLPGRSVDGTDTEWRAGAGNARRTGSLCGGAGAGHQVHPPHRGVRPYQAHPPAHAGPAARPALHRGRGSGRRDHRVREPQFGRWRRGGNPAGRGAGRAPGPADRDEASRGAHRHGDGGRLPRHLALRAGRQSRGAPPVPPYRVRRGRRPAWFLPAVRHRRGCDAHAPPREPRPLVTSCPCAPGRGRRAAP